METAIANAVIEWFNASRVAQKKHATREWTVLAGVVLRVASATCDDSFRVLAVGTGTKCLGRRDLDADGLVVNDCHAEVVARRALLRYLYREAQRTESSHEASIFTRDETSGKLRLKPGHELHLYISEAPCGDAAIYPLKQEVVDALVERRTQREAIAETVERSELRLTGAKQKKRARPDDDADDLQEKRFEQAVGIARVKSGRSDLPRDKQTLSMSCSDKIATWNALGVQGSLLLRWFEPLFLSSIVVAEDPLSLSRASQLHAMERALRDRLKNSQHVGLAVLPGDSSTARFSHERDATKASSSLSLNWTKQEPHWEPAVDATGPKSWRVGFFASPDVEVLMAATGFKEGAKKASKMDALAKQRVASRLSKWSLFRAYSDVVGQAASEKEARQDTARQTYHEEKTAVLATFKATDRQRVKAELGEWVGVPQSCKQFRPHVG